MYTKTFYVDGAEKMYSNSKYKENECIWYSSYK